MTSQTIRRTLKGTIEFCQDCGLYYLTYGNILISLTEAEYYVFEHYLFSIDIALWQEHNKAHQHEKFIPIPTKQGNLSLLFDEDDIYQLKLLFLGESARFLNINQMRIDYIPN
ncbi:MAG: DUF6686 family protein [Flavobacteriaceae bacterium]